MPFGSLRPIVRAAFHRRESALAIVAVSAIAIGLASTMFALTDPFVLKPLPYSAPARLATIEYTVAGRHIAAQDPNAATIADWRTRADLFEGASAYTFSEKRVYHDGRSIRMVVMRVTPEFLELLGFRYASRAGDNPADGVQDVLLTARGHDLLSGDQTSIGVLLRAHDDTSLRVTGFLPGNFVFPDPLWLEASAVAVVADVGRIVPASGCCPWKVIARLRPGVSPALVAAALAPTGAPGNPADVTVEWLADRMKGTVKPIAVGAMLSAVFILLVCAGNVANLCLARHAHRRGEYLTRRALGAPSTEVLRLAVVEMTVLLTVAAGVGLFITHVSLAFCRRLLPPEFSTLGDPELTLRTVLFAMLAASVVFTVAMIPALLASRGSSGGGFKASSPLVGRSRLLFGAAQATMATVLAVASAMLIQSYANLVTRPVGYARAATYVSVEYPIGTSPARFTSDVADTIARLERVPGAARAGASKGSIVADGQAKRAFVIDGRQAFEDAYEITPAYLESTGMTLLTGRPFRTDGGDIEVVVNRSFVARYWPGRSGIGESLQWDGRTASVVGVVQDAVSHGLAEAVTPTAFIPFDYRRAATAVQYVVRPVRPEFVLDAGAIRQAVGDVNSQVVVGAPASIGDRLTDSVRERIFATTTLTLFVLAAGAISVAGLVGIVIFVVTRRTREVAIRLAVGAPRRHILRLMAGEAAAAALIGGGVGLLLGRWLSKALGAFVYGIEAGNWTTALIGSAVMVVVMVAAALVPASRATRLSPSTALRVD